MIQPISVCIIARNEEDRIKACLESIRPYVDEIIVVDTGSTDSTVSIARRIANKVEIFTECNDPITGAIANFSLARQKSVDLASNDLVMWVDADDIVTDAQNIPKLLSLYQSQIEQNKSFCILLPYEYAHDEAGNVLVLHYRERIVYPRKNFKWVNPVHEVLIPTVSDAQNNICDNVRIIHKKDFTKAPADPHRNFRIMKKYVDEIGDTDPRQLYYLGLEYGNIGDVDNAIATLKRYVELSGWDDERCLAMLTIAKHYMGRNELESSAEWATKAFRVKEGWAEPYFHLGKTYYMMADALDKKNEHSSKYWEKCVNFCKIGLSLPVTNTVLFVNPYERSVDIHRFYNYALDKLGNTQAALESVEEALKSKPDDPTFLHNKQWYELVLSKRKFEAELHFLHSRGQITTEQRDAIVRCLETNISKDSIAWKPYHRPDGYPDNVTEESFPVATVTPHSQAWGIPESFVQDDLPLRMSDEQLKSMVGIIWKEYLLNDEVQNALTFLKAAPCKIRHSDFVERLITSTEKTVSWIFNEVEYDAGNAPKESDGSILKNELIPLPQPLAGASLLRYSWIKDRMHDKSKKVLDFGCIDGEFTNRWGLEGYDVTGLDICSTSVEIANRKSKEFNLNTRHIRTFFKDAPKILEKQKFDYLTCADAYEHIFDRVNDLLIPARQVANDDAKMLLVTPYMAWMQSQFVPWADPWCNKGKVWNDDNVRRAHVIAPTVWDVADEFRRSGWYVKNCSVVDQWIPDVPGQGNVCVEALATGPDSSAGLDIILFVGQGLENWTPDSVNITGVGGSEMAAIQMAKRLAVKGHKVRVYAQPGAKGEGIYDGVEYRMFDKYHDLKCDVLIASREAQALGDQFGIKAITKILWVHDVTPKSINRELALKTDKIFALSKWHKANILRQCPFVAPSQIHVTRNGLDLGRFNDTSIVRNSHKAVYSSSPDRGLIALLQMWPQIRKRVPDAELHIFYGFHNWKTMAASINDQDQLELINTTMKMIEDLKSQGVVYRDRMPQQDLAREFMSAGVWTYSTWFSETNCQLAGSLIFTKNGMKKIENIKVGDLVLTHKGRFRQVTELIQKEYDGNLYSIKRRKDFNPIVLTEEHPLLSSTFHKRSDSLGGRIYNKNNLKTDWVTPNKLTKNLNYLLTPKMEFGNKKEILLSDYVDLPVIDGMIGPIKIAKNYKRVSNIIEITEEFMYMLGLFAAEGCATAKRGKQKAQHSNITFAMHLKETLKAQRVLDFFKCGGNIKQISENGIAVTLHNSVWSKFLFNTIGVGRNKKIPDFVWDCSKEMQRAFYLGMFEGDGSTSMSGLTNNAEKSYKTKTYTSISSSLTYGIAQLLVNMGEFPSINFSNTRNAYKLSWQNEPKCSQHIEMDEYFASKIDSIDVENYNGVVYNFEVDEDHSYVTDRTVVHNCISAMEAQAAGLSIVTSPIAALNETVGPRGTMIEGDWLSPEYQAKFIDATVNAMLTTTKDKRQSLRKYAMENFSWDDVADEWDTMIRTMVNDAKNEVLEFEYQGSAE